MSRLWRTDSRKVEQYSVWTESAKNFTIGITLHPLALLVISFAAFLQFSNRPRIWVSGWFKVGVGREQGVGRKSSVIGAWQKAPSHGTLPHSQPTFAIETHIHIYYMWHTISSQQGWTGKLFFSRGGEGHGARPKIYGAGRVLTIFIHPCFPIFCKMLKTSNEKAWMKSGTLRMMALSNRRASH